MRFKSILFFVALSTASPAIAADCNQHLTWNVETGAVRRTVSKSLFFIDVPAHGFTFQGELDEAGHLYIKAYLSDHEGGRRSHLRGNRLYADMIRHFGEQNIQGIVGYWMEGTNQQQFFKSREKGLPMEEAALTTWSGQQAAKYGFSKVKRVQVFWNSQTRQDTIEVLFVRP